MATRLNRAALGLAILTWATVLVSATAGLALAFSRPATGWGWVSRGLGLLVVGWAGWTLASLADLPAHDLPALLDRPERPRNASDEGEG
jgi:hypothetical protein